MSTDNTTTTDAPRHTERDLGPNARGIYTVICETLSASTNAPGEDATAGAVKIMIQRESLARLVQGVQFGDFDDEKDWLEEASEEGIDLLHYVIRAGRDFTPEEIPAIGYIVRRQLEALAMLASLRRMRERTAGERAAVEIRKHLGAQKCS